MRSRRSARREQILVAMWVATALALLAGCGKSNSTLSTSWARVARSIPSLSACVLAWNRASLNEVRRSVEIDAMTRKAALMFAFQNGACGLAFPAHTTNLFGEQRGTYVSFLGGDFWLGWSPLGFVTKAEIAKLRNDASRYTNVIVQNHTGRVVLRRGHRHMLIVPAKVFINPSSYCKHVVLSDSFLRGSYNVLATSVGCMMTRTLLWGWGAESLTEHPEKMNIIGWQCKGSNEIPDFTPVTYEKVTCVSGANMIEARNDPTL